MNVNASGWCCFGTLYWCYWSDSLSMYRNILLHRLPSNLIISEYSPTNHSSQAVSQMSSAVATKHKCIDFVRNWYFFCEENKFQSISSLASRDCVHLPMLLSLKWHFHFKIRSTSSKKRIKPLFCMKVYDNIAFYSWMHFCHRIFYCSGVLPLLSSLNFRLVFTPFTKGLHYPWFTSPWISV